MVCLLRTSRELATSLEETSWQGRIWGGGGGGGCTLSFQVFDPLPSQRVPLCTILRYAFLETHPKIFLKGRAKKRDFLVNIFQKVQNFACGAEILAKTESLQCFERARKINLIDLKKCRQNFRNLFEKLPPPSPLLEKLLDSPLHVGLTKIN